MALIDMVMPKMGESIMECTVITWLKQPGDRIEADESVLEVATDKVDTEVPALHSGILKEILVKDGDVVAIGAPIARIETKEAISDESHVEPPKPTESIAKEADQTPKGIGDVANVTAESATIPEKDASQAAHELEASILAMSTRPASVEKTVAAVATTLSGDAPVFADRFYSPLVLNIAKEEGVTRDELDRLPGSGVENRVTKKDILAYVIDRAEGKL
ncbi:biotin/lipoyl-containing protein, partial [Spirosoma sp.]|uniref:biotin/lipoyl-containing protein n=1 Tax=Spirosoma sp. TaxID=1899569 RepID=UPI003B3AB6DA